MSRLNFTNTDAKIKLARVEAGRRIVLGENIEKACQSGIKDGYGAPIEFAAGLLLREVLEGDEKITDQGFVNIAEEAWGDGAQELMGRLLRKESLNVYRVEYLFKEALKLLGETLYESDYNARLVLGFLGERRLFDKRMVAELVEKHLNFGEKNNDILLFLGREELSKKQIMQVLNSETTIVNSIWVSLASQKNADDEVWERMLLILDKERIKRAIPSELWARILTHNINRARDLWMKRLIETGPKGEGFLSEVAGLILTDESLNLKYDVVLLMNWYLAGERSAARPIRIEGIAKSAIERMGPKSLAIILGHANRDVRVAGVKMIGSKRIKV